MKYLKIALLGSLTSFWACQKAADLDNVIDNPVFQTTYQIDGVKYAVTAGDLNTYLFTNYQLLPEGIWQLSGNFADASCATGLCPGSLTFFWMNNSTGNVFDSTWLTTSYYRSGIPFSSFYRTFFSYRTDQPEQFSFEWKLDDSLQSTQAYTGRDIWDPAPLDVECTATHAAGYTGRWKQGFANFDQGQFCFQIQLKAEYLPDSNKVLLRAEVAPPGNFLYRWSTGISDTTATILVPPGSGALYQVTVSEPNYGCDAVASLSGLPASASDYPLTVGPLDANLSRVQTLTQGGPIVQWIDPQGIIWRSDWGEQYNQGGYFRILDIQDYEKNENNQPTKLLRIEYKCLLYNGLSGQSLPMIGEGVIAVGWPG